MRLNAPKFWVWVVAVIIGVIGVAANFITIPFVTFYSCWFILIGFVILALATLLKGM
jgi:hypothetical protein